MFLNSPSAVLICRVFSFETDPKFEEIKVILNKHVTSEPPCHALMFADYTKLLIYYIILYIYLSFVRSSFVIQ
jgi:hypothetical protein